MNGPDTYLQLEELTFEDTEVPEQINFGGTQSLVKHDLIGGKRLVDAMGAFTAPISWSGMFRGPEAKSRALYLDGLRASGRKVSLTWDAFRFQVVIAEFRGNYQRGYQIPYSITCEVVEDQTQPQTQLASNPVDDLVDYDAVAAADLVVALQATPEIDAGVVTTTTLASQFGALGSAIASVSSFASASQAELNSVLQPLAETRAQVQALTAVVSNTIAGVTTLGGVLPNNPLSQNVARMTSQLAALEQQPLLLNLDSTLARIGVNAQASVKTDKTVTLAGGNLYDLAAQQYGDPLQWTVIARANGLTDPELTGINTLVIPQAAQ